jgi:cytidylate kinase
VAPLCRASDAIELDSSELAIDDVVSQIVTRVREVEQRLGGTA